MLRICGAPLNPNFPVPDADETAEEIWSLITRRDHAEAIIPPLPSD